MTTFPICRWQVEKEMSLQNCHESEARRAGRQNQPSPGGLGDGSPRLLERWRRGTTNIRGAAPALQQSCGIDVPALPSLCENWKRNTAGPSTALRSGRDDNSAARKSFSE